MIPIEKEAATWKFFAKSYIPEPMSGCWLWERRWNACGYGTLYVAGKSQLAHRVSFVLHGGILAPKECVLHRCDVPCCVNPDHLFAGMPADNVRDMEQKKRARHLRGQEHGRAKLTDAQVRDIRSDPRGCFLVSRAFGVSKFLVLQIRKRSIWKHVV